MNTLHQDMPATGGESLDLQALTRALLESALNAIMDEQADMACEGGANSRNGYRERGLVTPAGKITLRIPKLRCGTYFPEGMLERYSRADKAAAAAEMYANGVSTRKVERIAQRMGIDRLSSSQVSRICKRLDAEVAALRVREFDMAMPYLFLDAAYVKCRRGGRWACGSSSRTPTRASPESSTRSTRAPRGSATRSASCATVYARPVPAS